MYKDMVLKLIYHKEQLIKQFIKRGYFPRNDEVNAKLTDIDNRLAIFKHMAFMPGEKLDVHKLNYLLKAIYIDFTFLYKVLDQLAKDELQSLYNYTETHMNYLVDLAKTYGDRASEEISSTTLGTTVFFQSTNFNVDTHDEKITVSLGQIELTQGKKIGCFANINNIEQSNVKFIFDSSTAEYDFEALPYNYNETYYDVPGTRTVKEYKLILDRSTIVTGTVKIPIEKISFDNDYFIQGGSDYMMVTDKVTGRKSIVPFCHVDNPFYANNNCYITFFVSDVDMIEYNFNKKPLHTNFSLQNGIIKMENNINKVFLDVDEGFTCYFNTGKGKVFADSEEAIIEKDHLLYTPHMDLRDFEIREFINSNKTKYDVKVTMTSKTEADMVIENIYIKELDQ